MKERLLFLISPLDLLGSVGETMVTFQTIGRFFFAKPFRPFRMRMLAGKTYEIRDPDLLTVGISSMSIDTWLSEDPEEARLRQIKLPFRDVDCVEPLDSPTKS